MNSNTPAWDFAIANYPEPHRARTQQILKAHPEVKTLFGNRRITAVYLIGIVVGQIVLAGLFSSSPWWLIALGAYFIGAFANHALFALIHECAHNLIFKTTFWSQILSMIANLPVTYPAAGTGFRKYHLLHHRYQGELALDADLAGEKEAKWVGNSTWRKATWLLFFFVVEGIIRPARVTKLMKEMKAKDPKFPTVNLWDAWTIVNALVEVVFLAAVTHYLGWGALLYLFLSSFACIGLHPVGARWIQEHYLVAAPQETYSYYGGLNTITFNVGYHNEHHDLVMVNCWNLPKLKAMAPEFYDNLVSHQSWAGLLFQFLFDKRLSLYSRMIRPSAVNTTAVKQPSVSATVAAPAGMTASATL